MNAAVPLKHAAAKALRAAALRHPDTVEDFPWEHHAFKAPNKKAFLFLTGEEDGGFNCSMKLPYRNQEALAIENSEPTHYGMGRSGWVTFRFAAKSKPPMAALVDYLDESWRAVAPKKLSAAFPPPKRKRRTRLARQRPLR